MRRTFVMASLALLAACSGPRAKPATGIEAEAAQQMHIEAVRGLLEQDQNYAALAHVQQAQVGRASSPVLRFYEAEALRRLKRTQSAEAIYRELLNTPLAAQGHQGLGLLQATSDPVAAAGHFRKAVRLAPTDPGIRNDLGYALMLAQRYPEALAEFSTAAELAPGDEKSANNLIVLMVLMNDEASVRRLVADAGVDAARLAELRRQAQSLKKPPPRG